MIVGGLEVSNFNRSLQFLSDQILAHVYTRKNVYIIVNYIISVEIIFKSRISLTDTHTFKGAVLLSPGQKMYYGTTRKVLQIIPNIPKGKTFSKIY